MALSPAVRAALARNPLFAGVPPDDTDCLVASFTKGTRVMNSCQGEQAIGVVVQGYIEVYSLCADGTSINLNTHKSGDCFGIATIFTEEDLTTVLITRERTTVAYITRSSFMRLLGEYPDLFMRYGRLCNQKISFLTQKIEFLTMPSCRARLATYLVRNKDTDNHVNLDMSKEQLARVIGVGRSSLFREMGRMRQEGLIAVEGRTIALTDCDRLVNCISNSA